MSGWRALIKCILFALQIGAIVLAVREAGSANRWRTAVSLLGVMRARS